MQKCFKKLSQYKFSILTVFLVTAMVAVSGFTGEKEFIFPEVMALALGAWIAPRQPWRVKRLTMLLMMTASAFIGVLLVRLPGIGQYWKLIAAFAFAGLLLTILKTNLVPVVAAVILPVMLGTRSWIYPLTVFTLTSIIIAVQWAAERIGYRKTIVPGKCCVSWNLKDELVKWMGLLILFALFAAIALKLNVCYLIAPPILVTCVELGTKNSAVRKNGKKVLTILLLTSFIGAPLRLFITGYLGMPLWLAADLAVLLLLGVFRLTGMIFPPAGALTVLPMLLPANGLEVFPLLAACGSLLMCGIVMAVTKDWTPVITTVRGQLSSLLGVFDSNNI